MNKDKDGHAGKIHWAWSLAGAALLLAGALFPPKGIPGMSMCWLYSFTGVPCPTCGLTRSFSAIMHGRFPLAWRMNPFGFAAFGAALFMLFAPVMARTTPGLWQKLRRPALGRAVFWLLLGALLAFGAVRVYAQWHPGIAETLSIETMQGE